MCTISFLIIVFITKKLFKIVIIKTVYPQKICKDSLFHFIIFKIALHEYRFPEKNIILNLLEITLKKSGRRRQRLDYNAGDRIKIAKLYTLI